MGRQKWADDRFGNRVRDEREHRGWSQADMAQMLLGKGIHPMHPTTIAKIEAGTRSVRINEAVGIAELFDVSLDTLVGHQSGAGRDLNYVLGALLDAVYTSRTGLQRIASSLRDRLQDLPVGFNGHDTLAEGGREVFGHLDATRKALERLEGQLVAVVDKQVADGVADELRRRPAK